MRWKTIKKTICFGHIVVFFLGGGSIGGWLKVSWLCFLTSELSGSGYVCSLEPDGVQFRMLSVILRQDMQKYIIAVEMDAIWACPNYSEKTGSAGDDAAMLWSLSQSYSSFGWHLPALNQDVLLLIHCNVLNCFIFFHDTFDVDDVVKFTLNAANPQGPWRPHNYAETSS